MDEPRDIRARKPSNRLARLKTVYGYWLPPGVSAEQLTRDRDELLRSEGIDTHQLAAGDDPNMP